MPTERLWSTFSIRRKVLTSTGVVVLLVTSSMALYFPARHEASVRQDLYGRTLGAAEMVALGVGLGYGLNQLGAVTAAVNWAKRDPMLEYVIAIDSTGETFAEFNPRQRAIERNAGLARPGVVREAGGLLAVAVPIVQQGVEIGSLHLAMSLDAMHREISAFRLAALIATVLAIGLAGLAATVLSDRITRPLRALEAAAARVADGDYSAAPASDGNDEVGTLGRAFGTMVVRVRDARAELRDQAAQLETARDQAVAASRAKAEFLAAMSHEIRTPMNGVLGMLGLLEESDLSAKQREYARTASSSADALLTIIDDILDFSKIEAGKLSLERIPFDLRATVEEVAQLLAQRAQQKRLELNCLIDPDLPEAVVGDPVRLRQVLFNLGGNAVKFTEQGEVRMVVRRIEDGAVAPRIRFEVKDTGIGIPTDVQARLFLPFSQADTSTTRRFGGTGLGLSIARRLVALMDGTMEIESTPATGSLFAFEVPMVPGPAPAPRTRRASLAGLRVLAVDDNATNRTILSEYCSAWGLSVTLAASSTSALAELRQAAALGRAPDVALIDGVLPDGTGLELGRALRADRAFDGTRLVLLTSVAAPGDGRTARESGFDGYLTKPIRHSALFDAIALVMGRGTAAANAAEPIRLHDTATRTFAPGGRLLLVEDSAVNQSVAVEFLEQAGFQVDVAENGMEAVDARFRARYDAILMDCQMPIMDGYTATRTIRAREEASNAVRVPIIALTANALHGDEEPCRAAGMDDYLAKPFRRERLEAVLARWVGSESPSGSPPPEVGGETNPPPPGADPNDSSPISAEPFDLTHLGNLVGSQPDRIRKYLRMFAEVTPTAIAELRDAVDRADAPAIHRAAHKLAGSCSIVGARRLAEISAGIERLDPATAAVDAPELSRRLQAAFEEALTFALAY